MAMNRYGLLAAALGAVAMAACTTVEPQQQSVENKPDKTYITGSRIPVHEGSGSGSVRSVDSKQGVDDMMQNRGAIGASPKGGGM
jgi:hypothetical protein